MHINCHGIEIEVIKKKIKNLHLRVYPPLGQVKISAPLRISLTRIREFVTAHLEWIGKQQQKINEQQLSVSRLNLAPQRHYYRGKSYVLLVEENHLQAQIVLSDKTIVIQVPPGFEAGQHQAILSQWSRQQLVALLVPLIAHWEQQLQVSVVKFTVRQMKTRWGSCTPSRRTVRFNLELIKRTPVCLEYVVVHELMHLLEPSHNQRFKALMDTYLPQWRVSRAALNSPLTAHQC